MRLVFGWTLALLIAGGSSAHAAATFRVANDGLDTASCGSKTAPCRSITRALASAAAGDKIVVGPGDYGDLDHDGTPGDSAGEERPAPGCDCMIAIDKPVLLRSSDGAAVTVIEARTVAVRTTIRLGGDAGGAMFGKLGAGFTVTNPAGSGDAITVDAGSVTIDGNLIVGLRTNDGGVAGAGIIANATARSLTIEGNLLMGWFAAVITQGNGGTIQKNVVAVNQSGIESPGGDTITGNVLVDDFGKHGAITMNGNSSALGNAILGNNVGVELDESFSGRLRRNDLAGNSCGLVNGAAVTADATDDYWGAPTGPGPDPADDVCLGPAPTTSPFLAKPVKVKVKLKP